MTAFAAQNIHEISPRFRYTTMQLNKDFHCSLQVDKNNDGPSFIIGLGDYSGRELWIYRPDGDYYYPVDVPLRGYTDVCRVGTKEHIPRSPADHHRPLSCHTWALREPLTADIVLTSLGRDLA